MVDRMRNIDLNIFPEILIAMVSDRVGDHADDWTKIVVGLELPCISSS